MIAACGRRRRAALALAAALGGASLFGAPLAASAVVPAASAVVPAASAVVPAAPAAPTTPPAPTARPSTARTGTPSPTMPSAQTVPVGPDGRLAPELITLPVKPEPDGSAVTLDVAVYSPRDGVRHPAVILAHGFGGSRQDLEAAARELTDHGYVALTYSARGFGGSGGRIHLADPSYDGDDVHRLVDLLAGRFDVQQDAPGDPRVGMTGGSYGGALTLQAGGLDKRLDALVPGITWHDLTEAFFPSQLAGSGPTPAEVLPPPTSGGVFKRRWAARFFTSAVAGTRGDATCGRFDPTLCQQFLALFRTGTPTPALLTELRRHGPATTNPAVSAPTLLVQGLHDSLFGVDQADATARQLAGKAPVAVRWFEGGHDGGGVLPSAGETYLPWFDTYLRASGGATERARLPLPVPGFAAPVPAARDGGEPRSLSLPAYPGVAATPGTAATAATPVQRVPFADRSVTGTVLSPAGGDPAATTQVPGLDGGGLAGSGSGGDGSAGSAGGSGGSGASGASSPGGTDPAAGALSGALLYRLAALPHQSFAVDTAPLTTPMTVVGSPHVKLGVTSTTSDVTLFVSLWQVRRGQPSAPRPGVAPVKLAVKPGAATIIDVALPAGTYAAAEGSQWRVLVSSTDTAFASPTDPRAYVVALADDALRLPTAPAGSTSADDGLDHEVLGLLIALGILAGLGVAAGVLLHLRHRRAAGQRDEALADVPLAVSHLVKTYADGHRAVDDVSWRAERGQVVGLLGPNGAGKTTTIRMIMGLISPDGGRVLLHGEPVRPGSPSLASLGALIEGPGFLPHLSGRANLRAFWDATGRPWSQAHVDEALEVAGLGSAVDRQVRSYSQGMRQRLGIAQAMLGRPEVLLLDEPTNGLDPPQIAALRPVLRRYAEGGRTVIVSSHLLAEVEQTCTHVVVMHRGRMVLAGALDELTRDGRRLEEVFLAAIDADDLVRSYEDGERAPDEKPARGEGPAEGEQPAPGGEETS